MRSQTRLAEVQAADRISSGSPRISLLPGMHRASLRAPISRSRSLPEPVHELPIHRGPLRCLSGTADVRRVRGLTGRLLSLVDPPGKRATANATPLAAIQQLIKTAVNAMAAMGPCRPCRRRGVASAVAGFGSFSQTTAYACLREPIEGPLETKVLS